MKVNYMISTAAVLAALLTVSCTKDLQENAPVSGKDSDKVTLLIAADEVTKTTFGDNFEVKWEDDDQIGIFIASSSTNVQASLTRDGAGKAYFAAKVSNYNAGDQLCAYYPYAAANDKAEASKVTLKVPYIQTQTAPDKFDGSNNPMVAVPINLPSLEKTADVVIPEQLKFRHIGAVLEFDITGVPADEKLKSVQFVSSDGTPAGDITYKITEVSEKDMPEPTVSDNHSGITVTLSSSEVAGDAKVYMVLIPGTYTGNICVQTDKGRYSYPNLKIEAVRAEVKTITVNLNNYKTTKEIRSEQDYEAFVSAVNAGAYSAWVDNGEVKLGADISTDGNFTRIQKDWDGIFNGQGHTITQKNVIVPLFTNVTEKGVIKNVNLEGSENKPQYPSFTGTAVVARLNYGTIDNVTNSVNITLDNVDSDHMISGMVLLNGGTMRKCVQRGHIEVNYSLSSIRTSYVGGLAAFSSIVISEDSKVQANCESDMSKVAVGDFIECENHGDIIVTKSSSANGRTFNKFAIGGICAVVHAGTAQKFSKFENCSNFGRVARIDKSLSDNNPGSSAPIGGIVGRVADISGIYVKVGTPGFYVEISDCKNKGNIENSSWLFNGWNGETTTGARMGEAGGIVGYVCGLAASPAKITNCTSNCTIKGGDAKGSIILGGIAGMCSYTVISDCTSTVSFEDSSRSDLTLLKTGAVGGIVGYVRNNSTIKGGFVDAKINMPATIVSQFGICTAGSYNKDNQSVTISGTKVCGSVVYQGLTEPITVDDSNLKTYLSSFGTCNDDSVTYWTK